jgi:lipid-A-disaccharide synthase
MKKTKKIVIVAGEESGDIHAAALIKQLKDTYPDIDISGIGGQHMQQAGAEIITDLAQYGVTGITEVFRYLNIIRKAFKALKKHLQVKKPDLLILVDYPGFNLRVARYAKKKLGLKVLYYISPQIWAWKAKRIHLIKECVDRMAVILPFEKKLYEKAGVPVSFVGHPLLEKIRNTPNLSQSRQQLQLSLESTFIALLPGSRSNEIEKHMPVLRDTARILHEKNPDFQFIIPIAGTIEQDKIKHYFSELQLPVTFIQGRALECMSAANFVVVASGTASLECALLEKPMCIIYKSSVLTFYLAMNLIRVRFLGLCNLLVNKMMIHEFLHYDCNSFELSHYILNFHQDLAQPQKMKAELSKLKDSLSPNESDCTLFELVASELPEKNALF